MQNFKEIPGPHTIQEAAELEIFDIDGYKIKFGSVFSEQRTIVVFIRHFFCGSCQSYVAQLSNVPTASLDTAGVKLVVIGCGEFQPIKAYKEITDFTGPIYADPTRKLYRALGMNLETHKVTEPDETRASYVPPNRFVNAVSSLWRAFQRPSLLGKQGNVSQVGGEFIFGPGNVCTFASRMRHTEDHVEVSALMQEAGVAYP